MKKQKKISIFLKWWLIFVGLLDGGKEILKTSEVVNNEKYYTPYMGQKASDFQKTVGEEYSDISDKLMELNQLIKNLKQEQRNKIDTAISKIKIANDEIAKTKREITKNGPRTTYDALISVQESNIVKIKEKTRESINTINNQCQTAKSKAEELIRDYNVNFNEELYFCKSKLTIYWGSFYKRYKKRHNGVNLNVEFLTGKELMTIFDIVNPSENFQMESYDIIDLGSVVDVL